MPGRQPLPRRAPSVWVTAGISSGWSAASSSFGEQVVLHPVGQGRRLPTPSSRTPPEVSSSASRSRATRAQHRGPVGRPGERRGPGPRGEVVMAHLQRHRTAAESSLRESFGTPCGRAGRRSPPAAPDRRCRARTCPRPTPTSSPAPRRPVLSSMPRASANRPSTVGVPEHPYQLCLAELLELLDRGDPHLPQPGGRRGADAGDDRHLHRPQQIPLRARRYDDGAVGFLELARDLRDQLRGADADRCRQTRRSRRAQRA